MKKLVWAQVLAGVMVSSAALAAGFHVDVHSGRATGLASAVTANVGDASAVFFNPADILRDSPGVEVLVGGTLIMPSFNVTPAGGTLIRSSTPPVPPPHAYGTLSLSRDLAVGIGAFSPFGLKVEWPRDWVGRELIQKASLATYYVNPEVAYRFGPVKVGVGFQLVRATVDLTRGINFIDSTGQVELAGGAWGAGGNAGVLAEVLPDVLSVGATYRSRVRLNFNDGVAHFTNIPPEFAGTQPGQIRDQTVKTSLLLPDAVTLGLSVRPVKALRINADADYFAWQTFPSLKVDFEDPTFNLEEPKRWHHVWNFHLGMEYAVNPAVLVRLGAMWDPTPNPDDTLAPDLPDFDRVNLAVGLGYRRGGLLVDLGYQHLLLMDHTSTFEPFPGTYTGHVDLVSLSLGYRL